MRHTDIEFYGSPYDTEARLSIWKCDRCKNEVKEYREINAGDTITCTHCDSTYYVEEGP